MKRLLVVVVATSLMTAACDDDSPAGPSSAAAPTFAALLTPENEVPPVTNADASGRGAVTVTLNITRDASQTITAATADFKVDLWDFDANTVLTGSHIHGGRAGQNAPVIVDTGITNGEITLTNGSGTFTRTGRTVTPATAQNMLNDPAGFYFNVHTRLNTGGAVRSQLSRLQ